MRARAQLEAARPLDAHWEDVALVGRVQSLLQAAAAASLAEWAAIEDPLDQVTLPPAPAVGIPSRLPRRVRACGCRRGAHTNRRLGPAGRSPPFPPFHRLWRSSASYCPRGRPGTSRGRPLGSRSTQPPTRRRAGCWPRRAATRWRGARRRRGTSLSSCAAHSSQVRPRGRAALPSGTTPASGVASTAQLCRPAGRVPQRSQAMQRAVPGVAA